MADNTVLEDCGCLRCTKERTPLGHSYLPIEATRMFVCSICGNKRCPHAHDHRNECTDSNEPGQPEVQIKGQCFGVGLERRSATDPHVCVVLMCEDDGNWHVKGEPFSSYWLDDLIRTLEAARNTMHSRCTPDAFYGWKFK